jgi:hypothetical protein
VNPVTRRLLDEIDDPELAAFAMAWDSLEECLVWIYREGSCPPELEQRHSGLRSSLERGLGAWEEDLRPLWQATRIDGAAVRHSPFRTVLAARRPRDVVGNRDLMRTLPAAREAINHLLLERGARSDSKDPGPRRG